MLGLSLVSAFEGHSETIVRSKENIVKLYEYEYTVPMEFDRIRFDLNVLQPGSFWIDDVRISGITDKAQGNPVGQIVVGTIVVQLPPNGLDKAFLKDIS